MSELPTVGSSGRGIDAAADSAADYLRRSATDVEAPTKHAHSSQFILSFTFSCALIVLIGRIWFSADLTVVNSSSSLIAAVSLAHGMTLFVLLGRDRATMPGLFMASSAVIVGVSGFLVIPDPSFIVGISPEASLNTALFASTLTQIGIGALCLKLDVDGRSKSIILPAELIRWALVVGVVTLATTIVLGARLGPLLDGFGSSSILLICIAVLLSPRGLRSPRNCVLIFGTLLVYPTLVISGTGRLRAIALILAVAYVFFLRYGRRWLKVVGVVSAPLLLAALGLWRREYETALTGQHGNDTGLSSMFVGIGNFGSLIRDFADGHLPSLGTTLLSPLRPLIPESIASDWIPNAVGYQLAALTDPELFGTGFSTVATIYGDLWWNFGALGLVLGVPVLAIMLHRIDALTLGSYRRAAESSRNLLFLVLFAALLGGVGDVVWSGFHTWIVRMYARVAAMLVFWVLTYYLLPRLSPRFISFRADEGHTTTPPENSSDAQLRKSECLSLTTGGRYPLSEPDPDRLLKTGIPRRRSERRTSAATSVSSEVIPKYNSWMFRDRPADQDYNIRFQHHRSRGHQTD